MAQALTGLRSAWGSTISERTLGHFFYNIERLIASGTSIPASLIAASKGLDSELQTICESVEPRLRAGVALFEALTPYRRRFPEVVLPVIEVGEVSGTLDDACGRLAKMFQAIDGYRLRYRDVAIEPIKVIAGGVIFKIMFSMGASPTQLLIIAATTFAELLLAYILLRLIYKNLWRWPKLHRLVDKIHLAIPHIGAVERNLATARWARSFATMWHAGVPLTRALDVSSRSTLNAYYEEQLQQAVLLTREGKSLTESLDGIELTPRHLLPMLKIGEETARFGEALDRYVDVLEEEALVKAQQESTAAMVLAYLIAGLCALLIVFGVSLPWLTG